MGKRRTYLPEFRRQMVELRRAWKRGQVDTQVQKFEEQRSEEGWTWYFGGRAADVRLRCYDRRGPLRLEFQWRPDDKTRLLAAVVAHDVDTVWRMLAAKLPFPLAWYESLLKGETAAFVTPAEPSDLERAAQALRDQWGETLWAFSLLGMPPESFVSAPVDRLRSATKSKFKRWAFQAGPDRGAKLLEAIGRH